MRWVPLLLSLLLIGACGQLPRPFQPEVKGDDALLLLRNGGSLKVLPLDQGAPEPAGAMAARLADVLKIQGFAATAEPKATASYLLRGRAVVQPQGNGREEILTLWELEDAEGGRLAQRALRSELPSGAWLAADEAALDRVAQQVAVAVLGAVAEPDPFDDQAPILADGRLLLAPLEGVPGNGARLLSQALITELRRLEPSFPGVRQGPALVIIGQVGLGTPLDGWQRVALTWRVVEAISGEELGRVNQRNRVPAGSLDRSWDGVALPIAEGAASGIADLLAQSGRS